jgi:branched-chain amino acid transport system ATP-binding protein
LASPSNGSKPALLQIESLQAGYGRSPVVFDVTLTVAKGEIVAVLGHNGAGKTTTLKTIFGLLHPFGGKLRYDDSDLAGLSYTQRARSWISFTPAERFVFPDLSVAANLRLGALGVGDPERREHQRKLVHDLFPILEQRKGQLAGTLSGGQQRILSIGIALMSDPRLLLLDEPSLGVSPVITQEILTALRRMADEEGRSVVLVEQNVGYALREAERVYVMRSGRTILEATAEEMRQREHWWDLF